MMGELYARSLQYSYEGQETNWEKVLPKTLVCTIVRMYSMHVIKPTHKMIVKVKYCSAVI